MQQNIELTISTASSRMATKWIKQNITWFDFIEKLKIPIKSTETLDQYMELSKKDQDNLKDVGGYIGGELVDGSRKKGVLYRSFIALDLDNIPPGETENILKRISSLGCTSVTHSTRKHSLYNPRIRAIIPTNRAMTPDEYEPVARKTASFIGTEYCDPTTFQVGRLMYWPSCSSDSQYIHQYVPGKLLDVKGILDLYKDWQNVKEWPTVSTESREINREIKKQKNPLEKDGPIGAFCKSYTILEAIEKFLPDAYEPCDTDNNRLTYTGGSTTAGAIIYDDVFLYSNHATDPVSKTLCNAFDLVRIHKFGYLDDGAKEGTPANKIPSYLEMVKLLKEDPKVREFLEEKRKSTAREDFGEPGADNTWTEKLTTNDDGDKVDSTIENVLTILENHPQIKGKLRYEEFSNTLQVLGTLPWNPTSEKREWKDIDDTQLRVFLEKKYKITGEKKINDATNACFDNNRCNELQEFLKSLKWDGKKRLDTILIDYLGAKDNIFTREAIRKALIAAVARAMAPAGVYIKWDTMLTIYGPQGCGKSTLFRFLGLDWYSDSLQTFEGKDASESLRGMWIIEIGELNAMNRSETNAAKLFLSKVEDVYRPPYGRRLEKFPRKCIFFGTTNESDFLKDATGNRRFWVIPVGINKPTKSVWNDLPTEVKQIWAEAFLYWQLGESLLLSSESDKLATESQKEHRVVDDLEGVILEFLEKEIPENWYGLDANKRKDIINNTYPTPEGVKMIKRNKICPLEVFIECLGGKLTNKDPRVLKSIRNTLRRLDGWKEEGSREFGTGYGGQRGFKRLQQNE